MVRTQVFFVLLAYFAQLTPASNISLCTFEHPITSCKCYYDIQKFVADCARTELVVLPASERIPNDVDNLSLLISHNHLVTLQWDDEQFQSRSVRQLDGSHNAIGDFPAKFLHSLPHLTYLDLSYNLITHLALTSDVFASTPSLHHLDLRFNSIAQLPSGLFAPLRTLRYLDLSYNNVGSQLANYTSLNSSRLGFNEHLQTLRLDAIHLERVSRVFFDNLTALAHLTLSDNGLEQVPLMPLSLETLDLSGNRFTSLAARNLIYTHLRTLRLNRLHLLERIENYAFYNLLALNELEMQHCGRLRQLNDLAFGVLLDKGTRNLTRLALNGNGLRAINETYFHLFNQLVEVDLSDNPWICDCGITWLKMVRMRLINTRNTRCVAPRRLRNNAILELNDAMLPRCNVQMNINYQKALLAVICILIALMLLLILYLFYFVPYKSNRTNRFIGTESPYSHFMLRDDSYL